MPKKPPAKAATPAPVTAITDAILVLDYTNQTTAEATKLRTEAGQIAGKVEGKAGRTVIVCESEDAFVATMGNAANKTLQKIHIVAHGNQSVVGNYNAAPLAQWLAPMLKNKNNLERITLHSCMSGSEHPETGNVFAAQLASALIPLLKDTQITKLAIRGSDGESFTDSGGRNWVLKSGVQPQYRDNAAAEASFVKDNTVARGSARPKFTISRGNAGKGFSPPF